MTNHEKLIDLIRNKMTEEQFWNWVSGWKDSDEICREVENWDDQDSINEELRCVQETIKAKKIKWI